MPKSTNSIALRPLTAALIAVFGASAVLADTGGITVTVNHPDLTVTVPQGIADRPNILAVPRNSPLPSSMDMENVAFNMARGMFPQSYTSGTTVTPRFSRWEKMDNCSNTAQQCQSTFTITNPTSTGNVFPGGDPTGYGWQQFVDGDYDLLVNVTGSATFYSVPFTYSSAPAIASSVPADNATGIAPGSTIALTFSEAVTAVTGNVKIVNDTDSTTETINVASDGGKFAWSNSNKTLTITPGTALAGGKSYHVEVDATAFKNVNDVVFAGIADATTLNFSMLGAPAFSGLAPATNGFLKSSSTVGYTLSEPATSASLTFTRSGGTADAGSPHTCTLQGTALGAAAATVPLTTAANGCTTNISLTDGAVYTLAYSATNAAGTSAASSVTGITYDVTAPAAHVTTPIAINDADSSHSYTANDPITLQFSEPVATASVTIGNLAASGGHVLGTGATVAAQSASGGFAQSYLVTLGSSPTVVTADTLTITAPNVSDRATNQAGASVVFTLPDINIVPGACGVAASQPSSVVPTASLCSAGSASVVTSAVGLYSWSCTGTTGTTPASCSTNWSSTTGTGQGSVSAPAPGANNNWVLGNVSFVAPPVAAPAGTTFPLGLTSLQLSSGTAGSFATVTINYTSAVPAGAVYMKYGKSPEGFNCSGAACAQDHWYQMPTSQAVFAPDRMSVTLSIQDGGVGDHDSVASQITDPGGPAVLTAAMTQAIPTLSEWGMIIMSGLLALGAFFGIRRSQVN
jgi:methionine-rich copper-binding protein CopC